MHSTPEAGPARARGFAGSACARRALAVAAAWALFAACVASTPRVADWNRGRTEASNRGFSDWANMTNNMMVEKYGPPDRVETLRLVWENRGPWKKIVVWDELGFLDNNRAARNIEGTIAYPVPAEKIDALVSFSRDLHVSANGTELSARSTSEERNFLMLNLADEIVKGRLSPEDGRVSYLRTIKLAEAGKSPVSMQRLMFE
ncbi:MAG: hypothetical protein PHS14_19135 [Elusimicrobia bacterium]|nr:hypothetical protein [Elusimicrobiota bacterium]